MPKWGAQMIWCQWLSLIACYSKSKIEHISTYILQNTIVPRKREREREGEKSQVLSIGKKHGQNFIKSWHEVRLFNLFCKIKIKRRRNKEKEEIKRNKTNVHKDVFICT